MQWVADVGGATERSIAYVGGLAEISAKALRLLVVSPLKRGRMLQRAIHEAMAVGAGAIPIISLIAFFVGVIIALQGAYELQRLGAMQLVSSLVAIAITRELGPLITAIVVELTDPAIDDKPARIHEIAVDRNHVLYLGENDNHVRSSYLWTAQIE